MHLPEVLVPCLRLELLPGPVEPGSEPVHWIPDLVEVPRVGQAEPGEVDEVDVTGEDHPGFGTLQGLGEETLDGSALIGKGIFISLGGPINRR